MTKEAGAKGRQNKSPLLRGDKTKSQKDSKKTGKNNRQKQSKITNELAFSKLLLCPAW
jgi:hypothetical protein